MASASVTEIWKYGLASLTALVETVEISENNLQIQNLVRMAKTMLLACSPKMDGTQPQTIESDKRAALIDNVAARYLKFRLDRTLREDDAMLSCRVVRDALNIAVAFESDLTSKTKNE